MDGEFDGGVVAGRGFVAPFAVDLMDERAGVGAHGDGCALRGDEAGVAAVPAEAGSEEPVGAVADVGRGHEYGVEGAAGVMGAGAEIDAGGVFGEVAGDEPAGSVFGDGAAVDRDGEWLECGAECFACDGLGVGEVAQCASSCEVEAADDAGIGPEPGHDEEWCAVACGGIAHDDPVCAECAVEGERVAVHPECAGEEVFVPRGDVVDGGAGGGGRGGDGVECAVAADGDEGGCAAESRCVKGIEARERP